LRSRGAAESLAAVRSGGGGHTHVCIHQIGSDQEGFLEFAQSEPLPAFTRV